MSAQKNDYKHGYPNNHSSNHRYNDDRRHRERDEPRHFNSSRAHDRGRSRSRSYSYDQHKNYSRVHNEARFERISKAYAKEEYASNQYYAGPNANESSKVRGDFTKTPLRQPPKHQADAGPKAAGRLGAPQPEPEVAYAPRSAVDQEKIQNNLLALLENHDDDYLDGLEVDEAELEPQPEKIQKTEDPAPAPAQTQDPPALNPVIMTSASKKSAHHHRRAIEDDDGDDDNQEQIVQSQPKSINAVEEKKQSQKTEEKENDKNDAKSQHSSSDSFDKESQNSANKRKMKQLEKLKNELLRRKQMSAKNGGAQMSIDQQAQYLKDRSQEEMQNIQAEKAKRAAEREIREAAVRERRQQEAPVAKPAPARKKAAPKRTLSKPEKATVGGQSKESQKKEIKPKTTTPRQTPAKRPAVIKESVKKSDLDFKNHQYLVEEFSVRFNQVLAPYPPVNYDYSSALLAQSLNRVTIEQFQKLKHYNAEEAKAVAESPSKKGGSKKNLQAPKDSALDALKDLLKPGMTLVYELSEYPGIFRDKTGTNHDLRPNDDKIVRPSLKTFTEMPTNRLQRLLHDAYKKQLEELEKPDHEQYDKGYEEECLIPSLKRKIAALGKIVTV